MAQTLEQIKQAAEARIRRKKQKTAHAKALGEHKLTHDWASTFVQGQSRGTGHWSPSHCKSCGASYMMFKLKPEPYPSSK